MSKPAIVLWNLTQIGSTLGYFWRSLLEWWMFAVHAYFCQTQSCLLNSNIWCLSLGADSNLSFCFCSDQLPADIMYQTMLFTPFPQFAPCLSTFSSSSLSWPSILVILICNAEPQRLEQSLPLMASQGSLVSWGLRMTHHTRAESEKRYQKTGNGQSKEHYYPSFW